MRPPATLLALLLALAAPPAFLDRAASAASLGVAPTRVDLGPGAAAAALTLENQAEAPVTVQVQAFTWAGTPASQELGPTRDLIAVPPVFALAPGAKQIIRVALRAPAAAAGARAERAYRLLITEVPPAQGEAGTGVRFALRLSLPVFVAAAGARAEPGWTVRASGGPAQLELTNRGSAHLRVRRIELRAAGRPEPVQVIDSAAYVLPGQTQAWPLAPAARAERALRLQADTDLGPLEAELALPAG